MTEEEIEYIENEGYEFKSLNDLPEKQAKNKTEDDKHPLFYTSL